MNSQFSLDKFLVAQESSYTNALSELEAGQKRTHWMWYIFPQLSGLGSSAKSRYFAIANLKEADRFLQHSVLGNRLIHISRTLLNISNANARQIFGSPDDLKLQSCMTLFSLVPGSDAVFDKVLEKFFKGQKDDQTLKLLGR